MTNSIHVSGCDRVAVVSPGVSHRGQRFAGLVAASHPRLNTRCYHSSKGVLPTGAGVILSLLHGVGPTTSHAGSMLALLNVLTGSKKKPRRSRSLAALRELSHYALVGAVAIDLPGCNKTPAPQVLGHLSAYVDWLASWFEELQATYGVPLVPVARSASATPVLEMNRRYPGLIDRIVLLSPMLPTDADHSNADLIGRVEAGECELNHVGFHLMNRINAQTDWDRRDDPFAGIPTLILTGGLDTQVSDRVRARCTAWARALPHVQHADVSGATHDVLNLRNRGPALTGFGLLYRFLHESVSA